MKNQFEVKIMKITFEVIKEILLNIIEEKRMGKEVWAIDHEMLSNGTNYLNG